MARRTKKRHKRVSKLFLIQKQQVLLSKERTILSFMRTALTFIGVGLVIVNVLQEPVFQVVGYFIIVVGGIEIIESIRRLRNKQKLVEKITKKTHV